VDLVLLDLGRGQADLAGDGDDLGLGEVLELLRGPPDVREGLAHGGSSLMDVAPGDEFARASLSDRVLIIIRLMRAFVAGATGVIGRRLVPMLVAAGHEVTGLTRVRSRVPAIEAMGAQALVADVFDAARLAEAVVNSRPDVVVHQLTDLPKAIDFRKAETELAGNDRIRQEGTRNLVSAAEAAGAKAFVAQSIAFAYRNDGEGLKTEDDPLALDADWPWRRSVDALATLERATLEIKDARSVVLRYGFFYGPGTAYDPADGSTAAMVRARRFPIVGKGGGVFSYIHVDDAARAAVAAVEGDAGGVFNVVEDDPVALRDWLPVYADALNAKGPRRVPAFIARLAAGKQAVDYATRLRGVSNAKAKRELGWAPQHSFLADPLG
jgi:nucleoside-diphosphate-sugar epimerase